MDFPWKKHRGAELFAGRSGDRHHCPRRGRLIGCSLWVGDSGASPDELGAHCGSGGLVSLCGKANYCAENASGQHNLEIIMLT